MTAIELLQYAYENNVKNKIFKSVDGKKLIKFNDQGIAYVDNYTDIYSSYKFNIE